MYTFFMKPDSSYVTSPLVLLAVDVGHYTNVEKYKYTDLERFYSLPGTDSQ